jgi:hypothetical protein
MSMTAVLPEQVALIIRIEGENTSQGTPNPWGIWESGVDWVYWWQGAVVPTDMVTLAVCEPAPPSQVRVYMLVWDGETD